ncbi:hypothetical protein [Amycolatopsis rubida]|uniref:Uncharacterized protein n=1 Tax=Amycolatopsis rubida TaxID=112413 RepID=A0A1I5XER9_9PSEU|nr:hypothetical protein [Amycolatopsis rubida]SFQ30306.1 hypothetical protein SAMN05421854_110181 [Amycolatopsis rubida]
MSDAACAAYEERTWRAATRKALRAVEREARILRRRGWARLDHPRVVSTLLDYAGRTHRQLLDAADDLAAARLEGRSVPPSALARYGDLVRRSRSVRPFLVGGSAKVWHLLYRVHRVFGREPAWAAAAPGRPARGHPPDHPPHGRAALHRQQHARENGWCLIASSFCTKVSAMPKHRGAKQRANGLNYRMERPSVDARLHVAIKVAAREYGEAGTLAYERVLRAGLQAIGKEELVNLALACDGIVTKEDMEQLELALLARFGLGGEEAEEEQRMAS